jgi:hypothetical protein
MQAMTSFCRFCLNDDGSRAKRYVAKAGEPHAWACEDVEACRQECREFQNRLCDENRKLRAALLARAEVIARAEAAEANARKARSENANLRALLKVIAPLLPPHDHDPKTRIACNEIREIVSDTSRRYRQAVSEIQNRPE